MCWQDVQIERQTKTNIYFVDGATGTISIGGNANRLSIRLVAGDTGQLELTVPSFTPQGVPTVGNAILGYSCRGNGGFTPPDDITLAKVGDILKGPLNATLVGGAPGWIIETYLDIQGPPLPTDMK